jgi:hypothetical protein
MTTREREQAETELRALRARYDGGPVSPAIYQLIRRLEIDLAWAEHSDTTRGNLP